MDTSLVPWFRRGKSTREAISTVPHKTMGSHMKIHCD
uniref:Uncharacterized protein n=1 Tax=Arundo donax TaxID=35708 RepID=A0A0A9FTD0_ARUDO